VSAALIVYLFRAIDVHELVVQLRATDGGWLAAAALLALLGLVARARRWALLFPPGDPPPPLFPAMMIGYMANNVLPLRAGEVVRVVVAAHRWGHGFWAIVATTIVERLLDSLVIVGVLSALVLVLPVPRYLVGGAVTLLLVDVVAIALLVAFTAWPDRSRALISRITARWPSVHGSAVRLLDTFVRGLDGIRSVRRLPAIMLWTVVLWLFPVFAAWAGLRSVHLDLPFVASWTVLAFVGLSVSVPSAPGYVGVFHFAAAKAVEIFGVSPATALGFALVFHVSQIVPVTIIGWFYFLREPISLGEAARPGRAVQ
jgi:uncharacterized protein (TIRG00374 family)